MLFDGELCMEEIKVSIITVCFNSEKTIRKTIDSVFSQTYKNIEYIIIDGDSKDGTNEIIKRKTGDAPINVVYVSEPDNGLYDAMNKGIKKASGNIIGIVNSDDYYEPDAVENVVAEYNHGNFKEKTIFYGYERNLLRGEEVEVVFYHHRNIQKKNINHPTCFVTKDVYEAIGMFDLKYRSAADYDFLLRAYFDSGVSFVPICKIISNFELGGTSLSGLGLSEQAEILYKKGIIGKKEYLLRKLWAKLFFLKKSIIMR